MKKQFKPLTNQTFCSSKNDSFKRSLHSNTHRAMTEIWRSRSLRSLLFLSSISLQLISALSGDLSSGKGKENESHATSKSSSNTGAKVVIILFAIAAVGGFAFFLFKLWQKKKREEQYARLLKLFEEDDELEVELGLRD